MAAIAAAAGTVLLSSCSKDSSPSGLGPLYTLSGRVRLTGELRDDTGAPLGDRTVEDADGIRVYLVSESEVRDSTTTRDGGYAFRVPLGTYLAFARLPFGVVDSTAQLHLHDTDRVFPDTLEFRASERLPVRPNPAFGPVSLEFSLAATQTVRLEAWSTAGTRVRTLISGALVAGVHQVIWDGRDDASQPLAPGAYWVALSGDGAPAAALVFREGIRVSGFVQIVERLADHVGVSLGIRRIVDADGVRVRLARPGGVGAVDSTVTVGGRYEFSVTTPGTYRVSTSVAGAPEISLPDFDVGGAPVVVGDTLRIEPQGSLIDYPNPFDASGVGIEFVLLGDAQADITVRTLGGDPVWSYSYAAVSGLNHIHWIGVDQASRPVPPGHYWVVVQAAGATYYNLVTRE